MSKWNYYDGMFGNNTAYICTHLPNGTKIEARLYDCDGDFVEWSVMENGVTVANGTCRADGLTIESEEKAWDAAKASAEAVICYGVEIATQNSIEAEGAAYLQSKYGLVDRYVE